MTCNILKILSYMCTYTTISVCTHTPFFFVLSEYSSFPKDFYHICTASKGQNPPSSPPNGYLRPGPWDILPLSFHQPLNERLRTSLHASQLLMRVHKASKHLEVTGWDGRRIKQLSVCSLCVSKNPCCILLYERFSHCPQRWCWVLRLFQVSAWAKIVYTDLPA